jgi:heat shock protein HslJ
MRRIIGVLAVCIAAALLPILAGCGSSGTSKTPALDGTSWRLSAWSASSQDPGDFTITAEFKDGTMSGNAAVNTYHGPFTVGPGADFSAGPLASTKMAGPEPDMQAEAIYLQLLEAAKSSTMDGDQLVLSDADGNESLRYVSQ